MNQETDTFSEKKEKKEFNVYILKLHLSAK